MGVKITATGLENAVAGTELLVCGPDGDVEKLKEQVGEAFDSILNDFEKESEGVSVKASTLGSLEALLSFLKGNRIPVFDVGIGDIVRNDIIRASVMKDRKKPEYAVILAFDVKINADAKKQVALDGVEVFTADIIYHLFDKFSAYMKQIKDA